MALHLSGGCRCCGRPEVAPSGTTSRRRMLTALAAAPFVPTLARAQDLLDPTTLRSSRVSSSTTLPPRARPADRISPGYARSMAGGVTDALISLIRAYGSAADQIGLMQVKEKDLAAKLAAAIANKAAQLDEYRQGLFCSGCNRTKSDILSKGEQFPHQGQSIIKPTPEQIAGKERELQAVIDKLDAELKDVRTKLAKANQDIDTIRSQIFDGMGLWRTAVAFQRRMIRQEDFDDESAYLREREKISQQLGAVQTETATSQDISLIRGGVGDLELWSSTLRQVEDRRAAERRASNQTMNLADVTAQRERARVETVANEVAARITAFGLAGYLRIVTVPMTPSIDPLALAQEGSGITFRMGKYDQAGFGEILPRVAEFIGKARNTMVEGPSGPPAPMAGDELRMADNAIARLKARLNVRLAEEQRRRDEAAAAALAQAQPSETPTQP
ncbi:MAG: hypothetical protein KKE02_01630 [Alphaproteobacteria bacterium]|nr:hypothetical protein [Alphaproteobacteria bacterium]MBU1516145.1 hypothetical protein [Alphaproteobacteria bacterium]MBU2092640.1 hypothetical protein [Alphaproteobacteria bacterium]MBU2149691.1 hypothetical protein [Alphaproteobacteria bacterium]MBU2308463.1 hypothetical protein [Alphaproteobacteria bacterium]